MQKLIHAEPRVAPMVEPWPEWAAKAPLEIARCKELGSYMLIITFRLNVSFQAPQIEA